MFHIQHFPNELRQRENAPLITGILRGVEREALRVDPDGALSRKPHPEKLGSALTHPFITTDFSEALLEFITPPTHSVKDLFHQLDIIHRFTLNQLEDELIWANSMPCALPEEHDIPVARYGNSHNGQMKTVYRYGLGHRYGRSMQTVAGVHYNFSLPNAFWAHFHTKENSLLSLQAYRDQRYFALIRNFRRHYWLLILLFGASPVMCSTFVGDRQHTLEVFPGNKGLFLPYATSLRMGDLGYQSSAQESLFICYNEKSNYIRTLSEAILKPHAPYVDIGVKDHNGHYKQLNSGLLQIENEFYSSIRPKRSAKPGETALTALHKRGVEYIEVRCLDINPTSSVGISKEQVAFLDTFLLYCALSDSPESEAHEAACILNNQKSIVNHGRMPGLTLDNAAFGTIDMTTWARELCDAMAPVASLLDEAYENNQHSQAVNAQREVINDLSLTPSAKILHHLSQQHDNYASVSIQASRASSDTLLTTPLRSSCQSRLADIAAQSHKEQATKEAANQGSFDAFLSRYYKQYIKLL